MTFSSRKAFCYPLGWLFAQNGRVPFVFIYVDGKLWPVGSKQREGRPSIRISELIMYVWKGRRENSFQFPSSFFEGLLYGKRISRRVIRTYFGFSQRTMKRFWSKRWEEEKEKKEEISREHGNWSISDEREKRKTELKIEKFQEQIARATRCLRGRNSGGNSIKKSN